MSTDLVAGSPLEPPRCRVGRISTVLFDGARDERVVAVDAWYPVDDSAAAGTRSLYELLPGVGFTAAAEHDAPVAVGPHPLVLFSHGRSGTRSSYALLCEALAARGYVVIAPEHAGDSLVDWLLGTAVDDETNEANRYADARFVLDAVFDATGPLAAIGGQIDADRIAAAGHSYGGNTAFSIGSGPGADSRVRAVAGLQAFTRTMAKEMFETMKLPTLLVTGAHDATTPPATDADRAWAKLGAEPAWRVDIERAGHQGCSDVGLYLELAPQVPDLPPIVGDYVASMAADVTGTAGDPWRETVGLHVRVLGAFLDGALAINPALATSELGAVAELAGVDVARRGSF